MNCVDWVGELLILGGAVGAAMSVAYLCVFLLRHALGVLTRRGGHKWNPLARRRTPGGRGQADPAGGPP